MHRVFTLTLNPAVDISTAAPEIVPLHKLRCAPEIRTPGGGGINVARALRHLGTDANAIFAAGGSAGECLRQLLAKEGVPATSLPIDGETRENFAVLETSTDRQFRFVLAGPVLTAREIAACIAAALASAEPGDFLVVSGSLPLGAPSDTYRAAARRAQEAGVRLILDCPGATLRQSLGSGIELIKPSFSEFVDLTGVSPLDRPNALRAIADLIAAGHTRAVALSLGEQGAWYVTKDLALAAVPPRVSIRSTIGAGDSFVAGLVAAFANERRPEEALRWAVAAGTAALLAPGVELCRFADVETLLAAVAISPLE